MFSHLQFYFRRQIGKLIYFHNHDDTSVHGTERNTSQSSRKNKIIMDRFKKFPCLLIKPLHPKEAEIHPRLQLGRPNQKTYFCDHIHVKN